MKRILVIVIPAAAIIIAAIITVKCPKKPEPQTSTRDTEIIVELTAAPSSWGRTIPGASGKLVFHDNSPGSFTGRVQFRSLEPNTTYVLTINGKPPHPSNDALPEQVQGNDEKFWNFTEVPTDNRGAVDKKFRAELPPGDYDVKFFVKDRADWRAVLYTDLLRFYVK